VSNTPTPTEPTDDEIQRLARRAVWDALQPDVPITTRVAVLPFVLARQPAPPPARGVKGGGGSGFESVLVLQRQPDGEVHAEERPSLPGDVRPT
jgi:hypothetical protein